MKTLTADRVSHLLHYDPDSGLFTWKQSRRGASKDSVAGYKTPRGYILIRVDGQQHYAHRLAWLVTHGEWPCLELDHIDRDPSNNRLVNLRAVTHSVNLRNQVQGRGVSQYLGVTFQGRWRANLTINGNRKFLGYFDSEGEAHQAYLSAKSQSETNK